MDVPKFCFHVIHGGSHAIYHVTHVIQQPVAWSGLKKWVVGTNENSYGHALLQKSVTPSYENSVPRTYTPKKNWICAPAYEKTVILYYSTSYHIFPIYTTCSFVCNCPARFTATGSIWLCPFTLEPNGPKRVWIAVPNGTVPRVLV